MKARGEKLPVENEKSYPMVSRRVLCDHIATTTHGKPPALDLPQPAARLSLLLLGLAIIIAALIAYQAL